MQVKVFKGKECLGLVEIKRNRLGFYPEKSVLVFQERERVFPGRVEVIEAEFKILKED